MDAQALLKAQGWRGHGHTLHRTDDSTGLAKPLLISRKDNTLGIGKKEHCTSDQWWLNAFDQQLQGLDTTQKGVVVQTVTTGALNVISAGGRGAGRKWMGAGGGLYASFVRGGMLEGSISPALSSSSSSSTTGGSTPRDFTHTPTANSSSESTPEADERSGSRCETKEERKARRAARRLERAEKKARTDPARGLDAAAIVAARKLKKLERRQSETKEERRIRREVKRRRKEERRRAAATG